MSPTWLWRITLILAQDTSKKSVHLCMYNDVYLLHKVHFTGPSNLTYWSKSGPKNSEFITVKMLWNVLQWNCWKLKKDNSLKNHSLNLQFRFVRHIHEGLETIMNFENFKNFNFRRRKYNLWYLILYKMHMTLTQTRIFLKFFRA